MKTANIRARVSKVLKDRLTHYVEQQAARGLSITESTLIVQATVEWLDAQEANAHASGNAGAGSETSLVAERAAEPIAPACPAPLHRVSYRKDKR